MKFFLFFQLILFSGCAVWVQGEGAKRVLRKGNFTIYVKPSVSFDRSQKIPIYKPNDAEIEYLSNMKNCLDLRGEDSKVLFQRRTLCRVVKTLSRRLKGVKIKLVSHENRKQSSFYELNFFIDQNPSTIKKINYWISLLSLTVIPYGGEITTSLNIKKYFSGKIAGEVDFEEREFILVGVLCAPLILFSDGKKAKDIILSRLLNKFVKWL